MLTEQYRLMEVRVMHSDLPLGQFYAMARALRFADGPEEVHLRAISSEEIAKFSK